MTITDVLVEQARQRPRAVAIIDARGGRERRVTFAELASHVESAASWLAQRGCQRGHAILVFVPMSLELYVALLAMFRLGVVALFLDPSAGRKHVEACCARWAPEGLLAVRKAHALRLVSGALRRIPLQISVGGWAPGARRWPAEWPEAAAPRNAVRPEDPALVTFTSGSTGLPKAAVRTHGFLLAQHRALAPNLALEPGEIDLATLPVFTLANLASGMTTVIPDADLRRPGAVDAGRLFEQIERFDVTRLTASPAFFERLIAHGIAMQRTLPSLRKLYTGGAPVFPRVLAAMQKLAPHAHVVAVYGSTEAEPIAHVNRDEIATGDLAAMERGAGLLAGTVVPEVKLRVVRDRWGEPRGAMTAPEFDGEQTPHGEPGEIVVAGEHVLRGYLGGVGDAETKFSVAGVIWHRTGDAGMIDERGRLWLLGRCAARLDDQRGRLYPFGVECVAMTLREVRRAAMIGHRDQRWLVVEAAAPSPELERRLLELTAWAQLDGVHFIERMPVDKRHNAKIDYPALREWLEAKATEA